MKLHVIRSIAFLFFLFSGSVASAQTETDYEVCIQATQSSNDAVDSSDWNSVIALKKQQLKACGWHDNPETIAKNNSAVGLAYYMLDDLYNSKIYYYKCVQLYYSDPNCHYWLAVLSRQENDLSTFDKEKEIAKKIALRIISEGIPTYIKNEVSIVKFRSRISVANIVLRKISEL
jgi:hypothetical protein